MAKSPLVDQAELLEPAKERITCLSWIGGLDQGVVLGVDRCDRTAALAVIGYLVGEFQPFFNDWIDELCIADMVHDSIAQRETRVGRSLLSGHRLTPLLLKLTPPRARRQMCRDPVVGPFTSSRLTDLPPYFQGYNMRHIGTLAGWVAS